MIPIKQIAIAAVAQFWYLAMAALAVTAVTQVKVATVGTLTSQV